MLSVHRALFMVHSHCSVNKQCTSPGLATRDLPASPDSWSDRDLRRTHGPITAIEVTMRSDGRICQMRTR